MLRLIRRWLGLGKQSGTRHSSPGTGRYRASSATSHLYRKDSPALRKTTNGAGSARTPGDALQGGTRDDFNPYNTGKFDRGASWEKISKSHR